MGGHSRFLVQEFKLKEETVVALREGKEAAGFTPKERELIRFARRVADNPRRVDAEDVARLRGAGVTDAEIVEAVSIVMLSAFTNTLANTFKFDQDLEGFGMRHEYF